VFKVLEETPESVIAQRDLYDRPPSVLKSWAKGNTVMIGDAVHPMMPNLGQGGCQAIEDAYVLAQRLGAVTDRNNIPFTLQVLPFAFTLVLRAGVSTALCEGAQTADRQ